MKSVANFYSIEENHDIKLCICKFVRHLFKKNEIITMSKITFKRPGNGISPLDIDKIINRKLKKNVLKNNQLKWDDIH